MPKQPSEPNLALDNFDSAIVEAAWTYHLQTSAAATKGNVPVEVAAFIAGACWAKQTLKSYKGET